jgi:hypothetical protein
MFWPKIVTAAASGVPRRDLRMNSGMSIVVGAGRHAGRVVAEVARSAATSASCASKGSCTSAKFAAIRSGGSRPAAIPGAKGPAVASLGFMDLSLIFSQELAQTHSFIKR